MPGNIDAEKLVNEGAMLAREGFGVTSAAHKRREYQRSVQRESLVDIGITLERKEEFPSDQLKEECSPTDSGHRQMRSESDVLLAPADGPSADQRRVTGYFSVVVSRSAL
jgi:hypothetical protein